MNPGTNKFERLVAAGLAEREETQDLLDRTRAAFVDEARLLRPDGTEVPKHWTVLSDGEHVEVKGYTFRVAHVGESYLLLEPVGPAIIGEDATNA